MSRILREISCDRFSWKSKDENLQKVSPNFHRIFRPSLVKISPELRSGRLWAQFFQCPEIAAILNRCVFETQTRRNRKRSRLTNRGVLVPRRLEPITRVARTVEGISRNRTKPCGRSPALKQHETGPNWLHQ